MLRHSLAAFACLTLFASVAAAKLQTQTVDYKHGDVALQGHLVWDDSVEGKRPGVLVVHEWWGLNDYARERARLLAELGYVAFALDMYGKGKITEHPKQAGEWAGQIRQNIDKWQERALLGLDILKKHDKVDSSKLAAIGYCFGGATVMQIAYSGADVKGVVSFHGSLPVATEEQAKQIKSSILVCHGANDGFVPEERAQKFREALSAANADYAFVYYANAKHSFTNPGADKRGIDGLAYNKKADLRSWRHMRDFFQELFDK